MAFVAACSLAATLIGAAHADPLVVDPNNRTESRIFFTTLYPFSEKATPGWTGDVSEGIAGSTTSAYKSAILLRINFFRAFAGVPADVRFDAGYSAKNQQAALMMSANQSLSHYPPPSWLFYTADGAEAAAESNLALGECGPGAIDGYIEDPGDGNKAVGHRRWLFYPQTRTMGTGDIPETAENLAANAVWVSDENFNAPRPETRDGFVAWPPPGYVPKDIAYPRWSFSYPAADFSGTTITMTHLGEAIPVTIESRGGGAGENTIVWTPALGSVAPTLGNDVSFTVNVVGVKVGGLSENYSYTVTVFDPSSRVGESNVFAIKGDSTPLVNAATRYRVNTLSFATRIQARTLRQSPLRWIEGAETGTGRYFFTISEGLTGLTSVSKSGEKAFHFVQPDFTDQSLTFRNQVLPSQSASLKFFSRLGFATSAQSAHVEVSQNGGNTWYTLWSQRGTNAAGETSFKSRTVSLAQFAGKPIMVRFYLKFSGNGSVYTSVDPAVGWLIDDIQFSGCKELTYPKLLPSDGRWAFFFTPKKPGTYYLQTRPQLFGKYYGAWEPGRTVTATAE